ncbi:TolC family protein [Lacicoccus qingdaonensis]|uniref:Uncharacterized protein n=1 Tax=Lacicoccus qingdaonensis TaxID=576118 RepID=A0A1G9IJT7_9BACL|nr:hypothetical protein [Salinicoccus qingdaonensis]SDL25114.1 hypothetical protein SAMN05216216_1344 [Salinicoccus qingdaonensis]
MNDIISNYKYSKQFILVEDNEKKFSKSPYFEADLENVDDYLFSVVTSVIQKETDDGVKHLIQYEDKEIGWISLKDSVPVYRFKPMHFQVIEENFQTNELNQKMNIDKDFISHFKGKLLTVKSQVNYKGENYYSVFLKNKFHGFHHESHLDPLFDIHLPLSERNFAEAPEVYMISNLTKPVVELPDISDAELVSIFPTNQIAKVKVKKAFYWMSSSQLKNINIPELKINHKSEAQKIMEDIFHSVQVEREKSKEMVKSVLSAKNYLSGKKGNSDFLNAVRRNSKNDADELAEEVNTYKSENLDLKRQLRTAENNYKLAQKRLDHQIDYKERVEAQRDKYKSRMQVVEEKLENLNQKYKALRDKNK